MKNILFLFKLIVLLFISGTMVFTVVSCSKNNSQVVIMSNRVISQLEYFRGTLNSTANYSYRDNKIVYRDYEFDKSNYRSNYEYSGNQVIAYVSKKYDEYWGYTSSNVYNYESDLLQEILYRDFKSNEWDVIERWSFTYNGTKYNEILMETVVNGNYFSDAKLIYSYNADTLLGYKVYQFVDDWVLTKEVVFEYQDGLLFQSTLFYALLGMDYGPQEQFTYQYTDGYNTKVILSVSIDSAWVARNEILRTYNVSGKMVEEIVKKVGETDYNYRYEYTYELGEDNLEKFPFYDKPLYEYIYPTLSPAMRKLISEEAKNLSFD